MRRFKGFFTLFPRPIKVRRSPGTRARQLIRVVCLWPAHLGRRRRGRGLDTAHGSCAWLVVSQLPHATLPVAPAVGALSLADAGGARGQGLGIAWPLLGCTCRLRGRLNILESTGTWSSAECGLVIIWQSTEALEEFILGLLARFALGNMVHYSLTTLYLAVTCSVSCGLQKIGFSKRSLFVGNAWLDSEYMFCISKLLDEFSTFLSMKWTSPFSRRMEKCAQQMPQIPVHAHIWKIFLDLHAAGCCDDSANFFGAPTCVRHRCRVVPAPRESVSWVCRHTLHNQGHGLIAMRHPS